MGGRKGMGGTNVTHLIHPHLHPIRENCVQRTMHRFPEIHVQLPSVSCLLAPFPSSVEKWSGMWFPGNP